MVEDNKARTALDEHSNKGAFVRTDSTFRNFINNDENNPFKPEPNRYHLYVSYACPWAARTLMIRTLKGLEDVISISIVHPTW
jgi:putative glutathione S-transferase